MKKDEFPLIEAYANNKVNEVLNNLRAEIKQEYKDEVEHPYGQGLRRAIEIIDKYKEDKRHENWNDN